MNLDINDLVNLNDVPLLDTDELSPGIKNATSSPFVLTPDRKQMKKRAKKRRSKLQIESKRDSLGLFQNLDNKEISMLDDWTPTIDPTPKKRASNKFIFAASPIKQIEVQPENSSVDTQITESIQTPKLKEMQILPSAVIEAAPFVLDDIQTENIKTPEKPIIPNDEQLYTTPPKQIQQENSVEHKTEEKQPKTLKDLFNSIAEDDKKSSKLLGSAFKTPKSVSKMRSVIITPNLSLSTKKTPRIKLFSVTPKIPKETTEDTNTNEESRDTEVPRSPTFADLGLSTENLSNLSTPSKIQPPTPKLSTWTASPAMCLTRNGVELSSPSSAFKRRMRLPYKASPRREGMTPIPMSLSGEFSRSKLVLTPSLKKMNEVSSSENKNDEDQIQLSTSNSSIPEPPSSPTKSVLETPRKPHDTEISEEGSIATKNSSSTALQLIFSQELKERAEQLSNESAESRDISEDSTKPSESDSQANESKSQQQQQQTILNKFFADKRKNMNMKKQLVKAFEEEEMNIQKKDKEITKSQEETKKSTVIEKPKPIEGTISTGIPLPKTSVPKLSSGLRPTNTTTAPSTTKQSAPVSTAKKSTSTTPSKSVKVSSTSTTKTTTSVLQKKTVASKTTTSVSTSTVSKPVPAATPSVTSKKTSVTASATKTKPAPFVAATPLSQRSTARTPSTVTKAPAPSTSKAQTIKSVFNSATSAKENIQNAAPPTVSKLETKKRKRDEDSEFSSSSAGMASFDQLLKQTSNPEPTVSGSRRTTLLSSSLRRESSYFYRKEQEKKKQEEEDSLSLFEKQLEAAMKSGSAKANFGSMISSETDSPARKKAKIDC